MVVQAVVPVFLVVAGGWTMRRVEWLTGEADASLLRITINVLMPCLVFDAILGNRALEQPGNLLVAPLVGFGAVSVGLLLAWAAARWVPAVTPTTRRTFVFSVGVFNYGYVPLPLAMALFDRDTVAVLFVHNVGVELALWGFGLFLLARVGLAGSWRRLLSPPLLSIVATLVLDVAGGETWVPGVLRTTAHMLGQCAIPIGLLMIGAVVADHAGEFGATRGTRVMLLACLLRLGLLPLIFLLAARWLPVPVELRQVILLQAAMPAAVFPIVMARHYRADPLTALRVVVATSAVGCITMPLWLRFGLKFLDWNVP